MGGWLIIAAQTHDRTHNRKLVRKRNLFLFRAIITILSLTYFHKNDRGERKSHSSLCTAKTVTDLVFGNAGVASQQGQQGKGVHPPSGPLLLAPS